MTRDEFYRADQAYLALCRERDYFEYLANTYNKGLGDNHLGSDTWRETPYQIPIWRRFDEVCKLFHLKRKEADEAQWELGGIAIRVLRGMLDLGTLVLEGVVSCGGVDDD
jgi:hypothetical protein